MKPNTPFRHCLLINTNMKTKITILFVICLSGIIILGCTKKDNETPIAKIYGCTDPSSSNYNPAANTDDGSCLYTGNATFWYNSNGTTATIIVNSQVRYITKYYSTYNPTCGSDGCANFTLPTGSYSYQASSSWHTWNGSITITKNGCVLVLLQ